MMTMTLMAAGCADSRDEEFRQLAQQTLTEQARQNERLLRDSGARIQYRLKLLVLDLREPDGFTCLIDSLCGNIKNGLPNIFDESRRKYRIVRDDRPAVVSAWNIGCTHDIDDAGSFSNGAKIHFPDFRVRLTAHADRKMQHVPRLGNVIGI